MAKYQYDNEFTKVGFNGCVGSSDATYIVIEKCTYWLGGKLKLTPYYFNVTVTSNLEHILSSTQ